MNQISENKERFDCCYHSCAGDFCVFNSWTEPCAYPKCKVYGQHFVKKDKSKKNECESDKDFKIVNPVINEGILTFHGTDVRSALHYIMKFLEGLFPICQENRKKIAELTGKDEDEIDQDMFIDIEGPAAHILDWYDGLEKDLLDGRFNLCYAGWDETKQKFNADDYNQKLSDVIRYYICNHDYNSADHGEDYRKYCMKKVVGQLRSVADEYEEKYKLK